MFDRFRQWLRTWLALPMPSVAAQLKGMTISPAALMAARATGSAPIDIWANLPAPPPGVLPDNVKFNSATVTPKIAFDSQLISPDQFALYQWATGGLLHEGLGFLGYPYLAQLTQRPEYRRISEIRAQEATRKWIKFKGGDEAKMGELMDAIKGFRLQETFRELAEHDGFFGRGQIYIDTGDSDNSEELDKPLLMVTAKIPKDGDLSFRTIEPIWTYPGTYNSSQPWKPDFYKPSAWYVNGQIFHASRLLTIVGRPVPDILKPIYQFGGVSTSQLLKPYVDNWIRTRQSVSDLIHAFSVMILSTNMSQTLSGGGAQVLELRAQLFNQFRDNLGLMLVDKNSEEFSNVSTPLSQLPELLNQSQEQLCSVSGIPIIKLLGKSPGGLNGNSDGEIDTFNIEINSYQETNFRVPLQTCIEAVMLNVFGAIDEDIQFDFEALGDADEVEESDIRKKNAETDQIYINAGVISEDEARLRIAEEDSGLYNGLDLAGEAPGPPAPPIDPNKPQPDNGPPARNA